MGDYQKGQEAWKSPLPIEDFGEVSDEFMDGWFEAKHADPDWIEEMQLTGGSDEEQDQSVAHSA